MDKLINAKGQIESLQVKYFNEGATDKSDALIEALEVITQELNTPSNPDTYDNRNQTTKDMAAMLHKSHEAAKTGRVDAPKSIERFLTLKVGDPVLIRGNVNDPWVKATVKELEADRVHFTTECDITRLNANEVNSGDFLMGA